MKIKVAIIGGGYTGLCCAKRLIENNIEKSIEENKESDYFDITIYEKNNRLRRNGSVY